MQIRVRVCEGRDTIDESADLLEWLSTEPDLRGRVVREHQPPALGEMGAVSDVLVATLGGGGLMALARTLQVWLQQRRADVTVELEHAHGGRIRVAVNRVSDPEKIVKEVLGADTGGECD